MNNIENLQELIALIYELNEKTRQHWFLTFYGHVDSVSVYYIEESKCDECEHDDGELVYLTDHTEYSELPELIKKVRKHIEQSHEKSIP